MLKLNRTIITLAAAALSLCLTLAAFPPIQFQADPAGTALRTADDLEKVNQNLTGSYYLAADIDLKNAVWTPIGGTDSMNRQGQFVGGF